MLVLRPLAGLPCIFAFGVDSQEGLPTRLCADRTPLGVVGQPTLGVLVIAPFGVLVIGRHNEGAVCSSPIDMLRDPKGGLLGDFEGGLLCVILSLVVLDGKFPDELRDMGRDIDAATACVKTFRIMSTCCPKCSSPISFCALFSSCPIAGKAGSA